MYFAQFLTFQFCKSHKVKTQTKEFLLEGIHVLKNILKVYKIHSTIFFEEVMVALLWSLKVWSFDMMTWYHAEVLIGYSHSYL